MRKRYGKYFARWTGADGKRHEKACDTPAAAKKLQLKMTIERIEKKALAPKSRRSRRSPKRGRKARTTHAARSRTISRTRTATSPSATSTNS